MKKLWIITRSINEYNQEGDYFEMAFDHKPTFEELKKHFGYATSDIEHLLKGGGRKGVENHWYSLTEIGSGMPYYKKL